MGHAYKGKRCKECWWYECSTVSYIKLYPKTMHLCCREDAEGTPLESGDEKACRRFIPKENVKSK